MVSHNIVRDWQKLAMGAIIAPNLGLFANPTDPLVATNRLISLFACFQTLESFGVDIFAPSKQTAEESNFRFLGRLVGDGWQTGRLQRSFRHLKERGLFLLQRSDLPKQLCPAGVEFCQLPFCFFQQSVNLVQVSHIYPKEYRDRANQAQLAE